MLRTLAAITDFVCGRGMSLECATALQENQSAYLRFALTLTVSHSPSASMAAVSEPPYTVSALLLPAVIATAPPPVLVRDVSAVPLNPPRVNAPIAGTFVTDGSGPAIASCLAAVKTSSPCP